MSLLKVAVLGNPVLRIEAKPVPEDKIKSPEIQKLIQDMIETMFEYDGRGLAAPQIHQSLQIVVMIWDFGEEKDAKLLVLINPVIKALTDEKSGYWEGCLSLPGLRGMVERPNKISVEALDSKGKKLAFTAAGFAATVIQHEVDHLLGKVYVDRMTDLTKFAFSREYQKYLAPENAPEDGEGDGDGDAE